MSTPEPQLTAPPPSPLFQFTLRTLLLLFVVLASSMGVFGAGGIVVFALVVGLAIFLNKAESLKPFSYLVLAVLCLMCLWGLFLPDVGSHPPGRRAMCLNNMHQLGLALQNYHSTNAHFPPAFIVDKKSGKPLHSWRTLVLPFMEYIYLYKLIDFAQPWDSLANKKLLAFQLKDFVCPSDPSSAAPGSTQTDYFAVVGPGTAWAGDKPIRLADFGGDASNTIMLVEVTNSGVPWTEPRDLVLDATGSAAGGSPSLAISSGHGHYENFFYVSDHPTGACAAMADGSVRYLPAGALSAENLPKLLKIGGCKQEELDKYEDFFVETWHPKWANIAALAVWLLSVGTLLTKSVRSRKARPLPPLAS
jgi:hypothetical protein